MRKVKLVVRGKGTLEERFVAEVLIPPFINPPEALIWGQRFFLYQSTNLDATYIYEEGFCYWVPQTVE